MKKTTAIYAALVALVICVVAVIPATVAMQMQSNDRSDSPPKNISLDFSISEVEDSTEEKLLDDSNNVCTEKADIEDVSADAEDAASAEVNDELEDSTIKEPESDPVEVNDEPEDSTTKEPEPNPVEASEASAAEAVQTTPTPSCDYCGSTNHSFSHCVQRSIDNGAYGRWVIPSVGINVAVYYTSTPSQATADAVDSANIFSFNGMTILADHSNQDFCTLKNVSVGTRAYMDFGSYQQEYVCADFLYGHNIETDLTDANYNPIQASSYSSGTIICYTCNGCWQNVIIVAFQSV